MAYANMQEYHVRLDGNFERLKTMRQNMRAELLASDASDTMVFARSMERHYLKIWENRE
jgi:hypothetical protein